MSSVVRLNDPTTGHDGFHATNVCTASGSVIVEGIPAARMSDMCIDHTKPNSGSHPPSIAAGSGSVFAEGLAIARVGDMCDCGDALAAGAGSVMAGG